jgi:hypothetical protein
MTIIPKSFYKSGPRLFESVGNCYRISKMSPVGQEGPLTHGVDAVQAAVEALAE